jgi:hypothetical protein
MKKVAILLTGAPRLYKFTSKNLFDNLIFHNKPKCVFDIFMCLQISNMNTGKPNYDNRYYDIDDIIRRYKPAEWHIMNNGLQDDKFYKCVQILKSYEKEKNIIYDLIIKLRFETFFMDKFDCEPFFDLKPNEIVAKYPACKDKNLSETLNNMCDDLVNKRINQDKFYDYTQKNSHILSHNCHLSDELITTSYAIEFIISLINNIDRQRSHVSHETYTYMGMLLHKLKQKGGYMNCVMLHLVITSYQKTNIVKQLEKILNVLNYDGSVSDNQNEKLTALMSEYEMMINELNVPSADYSDFDSIQKCLMVKKSK